MKELKFLYCDVCKKVELTVIDSKAPTICCGKPMVALEANTTDAAGEKHVPVPEVVSNELKVTVGSVLHPMTEPHHIAFIVAVYEDGSYAIKELDHEGEPVAAFPIGAAKPVAVYEYCNLHGLWKAEV